MGMGSRLQELTKDGPVTAARVVYRKAVYRKIFMGRHGALVRDHVAPKRPLDPKLRLEIVGSDRFAELLGTNPHLTKVDVERFTANPSSCILIWDGDRLASSSWMTGGDVYIHEIQRTVVLPEGEHFSCRSWVEPDYRGLSLLSHMIYGYSQAQPEGDEIWGLVYPWNKPSIASLDRIGWMLSGHYWTRYVFGQQSGGHERFAPRPGLPADDPA